MAAWERIAMGLCSYMTLILSLAAAIQAVREIVIHFHDTSLTSVFVSATLLASSLLMFTGVLMLWNL